MNEKEMLDLLAEDAPLPPPDHALTTLRRARRVRRVRGVMIGSGALAVVSLLLLGQVALRPSGGPSLPPTQAGQSISGVVYLGTATEEQKSAIQSLLEHASGVSGIEFVSHERAYERFAQMYKDAPEIVEAVRAGELPESYEFQVSASTDRRALLYELRGMPGVAVARSPIRPSMPSSGPPPTMPVPEMGLPEAQFYAEQIVLLARSVPEDHIMPETVYVVDSFCPYGTMLEKSCVPIGFSAILRSELQAKVSGYATVVFVDREDMSDPALMDAIVVILGALPSHDSGGNQPWWLDARSAAHSENAEFEVAWRGDRWVVERWVAGLVS